MAVRSLGALILFAMVGQGPAAKPPDLMASGTVRIPWVGTAEWTMRIDADGRVTGAAKGASCQVTPDERSHLSRLLSALPVAESEYRFGEGNPDVQELLSLTIRASGSVHRYSYWRCDDKPCRDQAAIDSIERVWGFLRRLCQPTERQVEDRETHAEARADLTTVLRVAEQERLANDWLQVTQLQLGSIAPGTNTFSAEVENLTARPQLVGLDLRVMPGLWFINWQRQFALLLPPQAIRRFEAQYQWPGVGEHARLRVRFARATQAADGALTLDLPGLEREYEVGVGNPAVVRPRLKTEHFDIYAEPGSLAESEAEAIGRQREAALQGIEQLLGVTAGERIPLAFYPDAETKTRETGHTGAGVAKDGTIVEIYNGNTRLDPFHELAHVLGRLLGDPPAMFNEGFAVYAAERLGSVPAGELGRPDRTIDQAACDLYQAGELLPLEQLFSYTEIGSVASHPSVAYPQSASLVKYLIETAGLERFRQIYAQLRDSAAPRDVDLNRQDFERIVGLSLPAFEQGWRHALPCAARE